MGGATDLEGLAVEVFAAQGQHLAETEAGFGEDADRAGLLLRPRVVGTDADALKGLRSQTSSVIASSAIAERARRMPISAVVAQAFDASAKPGTARKAEECARRESNPRPSA